MVKVHLKALKPEEIIKRLKAGKVASLTIDDFYFEEDEPFEITEAGLYKTRRGKRAFVSDIDDNCLDEYKVYGCIEGDKLHHRTWMINGSYYSKENETMYDIVAKWED